jgi:hypothetical protein
VDYFLGLNDNIATISVKKAIFDINGGFIMKLKTFIVGFTSFLLITAILYYFGYLYKIPLLMFHQKFTSDSNGFSFSFESLFPLIIALVVSFLAEKIYLYKYKKRLG